MKSPFSIFGSFLLACLLLSACNREAPQPTDPLDLLPPATQTGENTLGFLLDGEPWTPNRLFQGDYRKSDGAFGVACRRDEFDDTGTHIGESFAINFFDTLKNTGTFELKELPNSRGTFMSRLVNCRYNSIRSPNPILHLSGGGPTFGSKVKQWSKSKPRLRLVVAQRRCTL